MPGLGRMSGAKAIPGRRGNTWQDNRHADSVRSVFQLQDFRKSKKSSFCRAVRCTSYAHAGRQVGSDGHYPSLAPRDHVWQYCLCQSKRCREIYVHRRPEVVFLEFEHRPEPLKGRVINQDIDPASASMV